MSPNNPEPFVGSFKDAIESYHRSQLISSSFGVISSSYAGHALRSDDDEMKHTEEDEEDLLAVSGPLDTFSNDLDWDGNYRVISGIPIPRSCNVNVNVKRAEDYQTSLSRQVIVDERSALLPRMPLSESEEARAPAVSDQSDCRIATKSVPDVHGQSLGRSTFSQTLFNATSILIGVGLISEPLAFSYAGWICGTLLIISYGFVTCYTAKFLASVVVSDPRIRSYADIGQHAFGARSMPFVNLLFGFELFSCGVIQVTLYADSLNAILPAFSPMFYKLLGLFILTPTIFLPLSFLSYASLVGIVSSVFLISVIFIDGFSKFDAPGSLWSPAETSLSVSGSYELGLAIGLFMAGFSAHTTLPSIARDMAEPHRFREAMNYSFGFATAVYTAVGIAGYMMFGDNVYDEVSQNLLQVPGYNPTLNQLALWMLVLAPLTKIPLLTRPVNIALESLLGLDYYSSGSEEDQKPSTIKFNRSLKRILIACERIGVVCLVVVVSILVPDLGSTVAVLGSLMVFLLCVIGPIAAKMAIHRQVTATDVMILMVSALMAIWGTIAAFRSI